MRKKRTQGWIGVLLAGFLSAASFVSYGEGMAASEEEQQKPLQVGVEGMIPIYARDVKAGVYEVEAESSSSMFRIEQAILTVDQEEMTAVITLSGKGYGALYMGTGESAAAAEASQYIYYEENEDGAYTYRIPVEALDMPIACAAFSTKKEKWYDRRLLFRADSLPGEAVLTEISDYEELKRIQKEKRIAAMKAEGEAESSGISRNKVDMEDGEYWIELGFEGGSGRASVESPARLTVRDGKAYGRICWNSPNYDYMKAGGETFRPVNTEGNSVFEIPVFAFDEKISVVGDTTAMGTPHEIEYILTFYGDSVEPLPAEQDKTEGLPGKIGIVLTAAVVMLLILVYAGRKKEE